VFGTRLRQQRFTQADFALDALNKPDPIGNFATRISGGWLLFDSFHSQKSVHSADLMRKSAASSAQSVDQKIVFDVVQTYEGVLYAERRVDIAQHELETAEALLSSVDDHVRAGLAVESDRMLAQVSVAARRQGLIAARGDVDLAWAQLRFAMGAPELKTSPLQPIEQKTFPNDDLEQELEMAIKNRHDLAALTEMQSAQAAAESAARLSLGPRVSAYGNWEDDRQTPGGQGGNSWVAGVQIGIDVLPFGKRAQLAKEKAARARVDARLNAYQQQVRLQVNQAHIQRQTAQLSLETARTAIDQATESLRILRNRYEAGLATITDLLRAEDAEREAQVNYWHAVYGNTLAYAQQLFATGRLTPDAAEELQ
jgi:outer membrane protein TolC